MRTNFIFSRAAYVLLFSLSLSLTSLSQKCGVLTFTVTPHPNITTGNTCQGDFTADATFDPTAPNYKCKCCEFRQKIKGAFYRDGNKISFKLLGPTGMGPHPEFLLPGAATTPTEMSETDYQEDYVDYGTGPARYGHRDQLTAADQSYTKGGAGADATTPDASGCGYTMRDTPGFSNCIPGHSYKVDVKFEDKIITTCELCDGCKSIETAIKVSVTIPAPTPPPPPPPPPPKKGIGPDFTSFLVFFLLAAGWIMTVVRKRYRATH